MKARSALIRQWDVWVLYETYWIQRDIVFFEGCERVKYTEYWLGTKPDKIDITHKKTKKKQKTVRKVTWLCGHTAIRCICPTARYPSSLGTDVKTNGKLYQKGVP